MFNLSINKHKGLKMYNKVAFNRVGQPSFCANPINKILNDSVKISFKKIINRMREVPERGRFGFVSESFTYRGYKVNLQVANCEKGELLPKIQNPQDYRRMTVSVKKIHGNGLQNSKVLAIGEKHELLNQVKELDTFKIVEFIEKAFEKTK